MIFGIPSWSRRPIYDSILQAEYGLVVEFVPRQPKRSPAKTPLYRQQMMHGRYDGKIDRRAHFQQHPDAALKKCFPPMCPLQNSQVNLRMSYKSSSICDATSCPAVLYHPATLEIRCLRPYVDPLTLNFSVTRYVIAHSIVPAITSSRRMPTVAVA
jgi:hypothetical protein